VVLTRQAAGEEQVAWDGKRLGPWVREVDGSDVVINLAGRSASCRYTKGNLTEMMRSRVRSARVVGQAIAAASRPPRVWLQMSTATIYAHTYGAPKYVAAQGRTRVQALPARRSPECPGYLP
jgi:NAD dependent epimerase/dehydratase family enzyme